MIEKEMEDLLWKYPEKFFHEPLRQFSRQQRSAVGRSDLIFIDKLGHYLVVEVKKGKLGRDAIPQVLDYFGVMKRQFPDKPVEMMLVANTIPEERRLACEHYNIDPREIAEKKFRDVASEEGFEFASEKGATLERPLSQIATEDRFAVHPPRQHSTAASRAAEYELNPGFHKEELRRLIDHFINVVRRHIDKSLAVNLRTELLDRNPPRMERKTLLQLARWCNTNNPVYWDGMEVARKISMLLFGSVIDRGKLGT